ncbi:FG-GAP-like repeat-containing protein [Roseateles violae]|uniref:FG-GAP-like repeat-containing protein n=1 Tax=Roseateles violae TaxID=3058042 RepID=A0ABT8DJW6_9BURK|nr:FG-GAP-like repeat-containing protein [Pelomonas sp. PFR6]MDN3918716.1 FG-GAP-like repeat-containing protein [Pelomonas sp. PFR6]
MQKFSMAAPLARRAAWLWAAFVLSACGGGGGGGGGDPVIAPPALTLSADVYPLASGDRRSWRSTLTPTAPLRHERVGEAVTVGSGTALLALSGTQEAEDSEYLQRSATGISTVPGPGSDPLTAAVGPLELLRFGIAQGQTVLLFERSVSADVDGDGRPDGIDLRVESLFIGKEALTTALGSFPDASHVRATVRTAIRLAAGGAAQTLVYTEDSWYAPELGPVKISSTTTSNGTPLESTAEELVAYRVGSRRSTTTPAALGTTTPAAGAPLDPLHTIELDFSAALDPLSLRGAAGLVLLDGAGQTVPIEISQSQDLKHLSIRPKSTRLPDQRYELRNAGQASDLAGNALPASVLSFFVDTTPPLLISSSPARDSTEASTTEPLRLRFDEPIKASSSAPPRVRLYGPSSTDYLPATISGDELLVALPQPLQRNARYTLELYEGVSDAAGNTPARFFVDFRTDPGPLARPLPLAAEAIVNAIALADIDGDGRRDLLVAAQRIGSYEKWIGVRRQQADGRYGDVQKLLSLGEGYLFDITALAVIDADGDGLRDIALYGQSGMQLWRQQAGGGFVAEAVPANLASWRIYGSDLGSSGGRGTLAVAELGRFNFLHRDAAGSWTSVAQLSAGADFVAAWQLADMNGDGLPDLVWLRASAGGALELVWAPRQGAGFGAERGTRTLPVELGSQPDLAIGDVDGDGRPDVVLVGSGSDQIGRVLLLRQQADGSFAAPLVHASSYSPRAVLIGDVDGDGRADLLVAHDTASRLGVYLQAADGTLQAERLFESGYAYYGANQLALLDMNADGRMDIVAKSDLLMGRSFSGAWPLGAPAAAALRTQALDPAAAPASKPSRSRGLGRLLAPAAARQ